MIRVVIFLAIILCTSGRAIDSYNRTQIKIIKIQHTIDKINQQLNYIATVPCDKNIISIKN